MWYRFNKYHNRFSDTMYQSAKLIRLDTWYMILNKPNITAN